MREESNQPPAWEREGALHPRLANQKIRWLYLDIDNWPNKVNKLCFDSSEDNSDQPTATFENNNNRI